MTARSYSDIRDQIGREIADLALPEARKSLIEHLTELTFELDRLKESQRVLGVALRARDVLACQSGQTAVPGGFRSLELDPREALDTAEGLYGLEWNEEATYRWTGPGKETLIRVWLDRAVPMMFEMVVLSYGDERNRGAVGLTVDGLPIALREIDDKVMRSDPFPIIGESLYTEVVIHVPWLSSGAQSPPKDEEAASGRGGNRRRQRPTASGGSVADDRSRGIAIIHMRFLSAA
jgi:hypothetical protein